MINVMVLVRYEGYSVDIINEISQILGFNYTIKLVEDGAYGSYNKQTGKWNGMIGKEQPGKKTMKCRGKCLGLREYCSESIK
jgi:hypothetical protein